ncbi:PREDICTED: uncharacterized protein LOC104802418 [Tarenaya hassleriana]|uniref:uncharacterized protein LOC104802418 n=1 Tax=Tarenaya hassleriana TaxID=28532 RepID=UPI00053C275E|nr:PREDICTED: uncharacterized protein LOC104802418 [Tarenaya hassleriana]
MEKIPIFVALFALVLIVSKASEAHRVGKFSETIKDVDEAKILMDELKEKELKVKGLKTEVNYLTKSEKILDKLMEKNLNDKDIQTLSTTLTEFHTEWSVKASNSVVPMKEVKYMSLIAKILQDLKKRLDH